MRPVDFVVYYCMQRFKTGNLNFNTPLGRACGVVAFIIGNLVFMIIEFVLYLSAGYQISGHQIPFTIVFTGVYFLIGAIAYYIYNNKKRYQYIQSSRYKAFTLEDNVGFAISVIAFVLCPILMAAISVYIGN